MSAQPGGLVCCICLWEGRDTPERIIPSDALAVTIYQGNAYCVPHYHERRYVGRDASRT